jgi:hypothetical protein
MQSSETKEVNFKFSTFSFKNPALAMKKIFATNLATYMFKETTFEFLPMASTRRISLASIPSEATSSLTKIS